LFVDPADPEHLYAQVANSSNGGWLSLNETHDGGRNWTQLKIPASEVTDFAASPVNPGIVHLRKSNSMWVSLGNGATWTASVVAGNPPVGFGLFLMIASKTDERVAFQAGGGGLTVTLDTGQTWVPRDMRFSPLTQDIEPDHRISGRVYVATTDAIWQSDDLGETWMDVSQNAQLEEVVAIVIDPVVSGRVFALDRLIHQIQLDSDDDAVGDDIDNCILTANPDQHDSDGDGYGNACDADIAPPSNDCVVDGMDVAALRTAFFATPQDANWNPDADFNNNGAVNSIDLGVMRRWFMQRPGGYRGSALGCL